MLIGRYVPFHAPSSSHQGVWYLTEGTQRNTPKLRKVKFQVFNVSPTTCSCSPSLQEFWISVPVFPPFYLLKGVIPVAVPRHASTQQAIATTAPALSDLDCCWSDPRQCCCLSPIPPKMSASFFDQKFRQWQIIQAPEKRRSQPQGQRRPLRECRSGPQVVCLSSHFHDCRSGGDSATNGPDATL